jgi:transposase
MQSDDLQFTAGIDWASRKHDVCLFDKAGAILGERSFNHDAEGLNALADWLLTTTGATAEAIGVAIEVPHGPVVESLMERGFPVFSINPKQLDRFRDRFSPAGAKDDRRDARVMGHCLRTDRPAFRLVSPADPLTVELREWSRIAEDLGKEQVRLTNRLRDQLWRYFPQIISLNDDLAADWMLSLLMMAPTPERAHRLRKTAIETLLKRHRIRRIDADGVMAILRQKSLSLAPGTVEAASAHVKLLVEQLQRTTRDIAKANHRLDELMTALAEAGEAAEGDDGAGQRDVTILRSLPGIGRVVGATLLAEASEPLRRRDYHALRCLSGVAPVTKRSGKTKIVQRRRAANPRLVNAVYHWANVAMQRDPRSRAKYAALRERGHSHPRALRSLADRLLLVACKMLETQTAFAADHKHG